MIQTNRSKKIGFVLLGAIFALLLAVIPAIWVNGLTKAEENPVELVGATADDPTLSVDTDGYSFEETPYAIVGTPYRVFSCTAEDMLGRSIAVKTKVFNHYYSDGKIQCSLENGAFTPSGEGYYTVEYSASDAWGRETVFVYDVQAIKTTAVSVDKPANSEAGKAGSKAQVKALSYQNASGRFEYSVTAVNDEYGVSYELDDELSFLPMYAGEYELIYSYHDYITSGEVRSTMTVSATETPVIFGDVNIPKYMITGNRYALPEIEAYSFINGYPVSLCARIFVSGDTNRAEELNAGEVFEAKDEGKINFEYRLSFKGHESSVVYTTTVVDVGYNTEFKMDKYFYGESATVAVNNSGASITTSSEDKIDFINPVLAKEIQMLMSFSTMHNDFNKLSIWLTDSVDSDIVVKYSIIKNGPLSVLSLNDNMVNVLSSKVSFSSADTFSFEYFEETKTITLNELNPFVVDKTLGGEEFNGFPSGFAYISYSAEDIQSEITFNVSRINNQLIYNMSGDGVAPHIIYSTYQYGYHKVGDTVKLDSLYVCDVLSSEFTVEYSVLTPENKVLIKDLDYKKDYHFTAKSVGSYIVSIVVNDAKGNKKTYSYGITVVDSEAPRIQIDTVAKKEYKQNDKFTVVGATYTDNLDPSDSLIKYICVMDPEMRTYAVNAGDSIKLEKKGIYTVYYYAVDTSGNMTLESYDLTVS